MSARPPRMCKTLTAQAGGEEEAVTWRQDLQAVSFRPEGHGAACMIHRLAIRTLAGRLLTPEECLSFAASRLDLLQAAAARKIAAHQIAPERSLHLTSRDVRRLPLKP